METKWKNEFSDVTPQIAAEMGCISRIRHMNGKKPVPIYGILTDSSRWQFLMLCEDMKLRVSRIFIFEYDYPAIYRWVYTLLKKAQQGTPSASKTSSAINTPTTERNETLHNVQQQLTTLGLQSDEDDSD